MRYLPHTSSDIASMLKTVGADSLDGMFKNVPHDHRQEGILNLPESLTEWELNDLMDEISGSMATAPEYKVFMGAGSYQHYIPETARYLLGRSEFVTSYTPYQPEMSQGTLQAIYEYQTLTAKLCGMETANASLYDGASALAEALLMSIRITKRKKVAISSTIHPFYRQVVQTYFRPTDYEIIELPYLENGHTDISSLGDMDDLAAIAVQSPNFFGCIEDIKGIGEKVHQTKTLLVASFTEPLAFGLYKSPGKDGADIVCGEGQSLGIPQSFGGPGLGMFATRMKYVRNMPGRLVGQTMDKMGSRGFVLTLATREQHIRREKATSNVCTNSSLNALAASMYMASLGATGFSDLSRLNYDKSEYLKKELRETGFSIAFESPTFNEFVVEFPENFEKTHQRLLKEKIVAGLALDSFYPELINHYLLCVTETMTRKDMDALVKAVKS